MQCTYNGLSANGFLFLSPFLYFDYSQVGQWWFFSKCLNGFLLLLARTDLVDWGFHVTWLSHSSGCDAKLNHAGDYFLSTAFCLGNSNHRTASILQRSKARYYTLKRFNN